MPGERGLAVTSLKKVNGCAWAQRVVAHAGREMTIAAWAKELGTSRGVLFYRIRKWGAERALTTPVRTYSATIHHCSTCGVRGHNETTCEVDSRG